DRAVIKKRGRAAADIEDASLLRAEPVHEARKEFSCLGQRLCRSAEPARHMIDMSLIRHHALAMEPRMRRERLQRFRQRVGIWIAAAVQANVDLEAEANIDD